VAFLPDDILKKSRYLYSDTMVHRTKYHDVEHTTDCSCGGLSGGCGTGGRSIVFSSITAGERQPGTTAARTRFVASKGEAIIKIMVIYHSNNIVTALTVDKYIIA
jgi:hypothetical protein